MIRALALVATLVGVTPAADARAFDYRDARGVRHWNHYGTAGVGVRAYHHHVRRHRPHVRIVRDRVKFVPLDDGPAPSAPAATVIEETKPESKIPKTENSPMRGPVASPYGVLVAPRAVPVELFKPKGAE